MPKITSATVAEHRAAQSAALIRAGEEVLASAGLGGFTPTSVSERAGIARSSFYDYFPSKDDLLVAISIAAMERWDEEMEKALQGVAPGLDQLRAFVDETMRMTAEGRHTIATVVREAEISPSSLDELMVLHESLFRPVTRLLTGLGMDSSATAAALINGILSAGVELVSHGVDHRQVADDVYRLLTRGLSA